MMGPILALLITLGDPPPQAPQTVRLDFPENVELKLVVDYVATTLGLNVLYEDELLANKRVALRAAGPIARDALLGMLRTVLRSRGLALVAAEQPGWVKIVPAERLSIEAGSPQRELPGADADEADVITYVLPVTHDDVTRTQTAITPYLSKPGGSVLVATEARLLVITDYTRNVRRIAEVAALLDVASAAVVVETIPVRNQEPAELAALVTRLLTERERIESPTAAVPLPGTRASFTLQPEPLAGGLVAIGSPNRVSQARELVARFDVTVARTSEVYQPKSIAANRLRLLVEQLIGGCKLVTDEASNTVVITATSDQHAAVQRLLARFDMAPRDAATPLRFYKLLNRRADDVFATLGALLGGEGVATVSQRQSTENGFGGNGSLLPIPGPNRPPPGPEVEDRS